MANLGDEREKRQRSWYENSSLLS